jgi:hypothetical protein
MPHPEIRQIPNFLDYLITKDGRIWSHISGKWLNPGKNKHGYFEVRLQQKGKGRTRPVHRLLLEAWVGPCPEGMECRHLNGNPSDNRLENLKWGTRSENIADAVRHGTNLNFFQRGENAPRAKLTKQQALLVYNLYHKAKYKITNLAKEFGVSRSAVYHIIEKRTWKCLWD